MYYKPTKLRHNAFFFNSSSLFTRHVYQLMKGKDNIVIFRKFRKFGDLMGKRSGFQKHKRKPNVGNLIMLD